MFLNLSSTTSRNAFVASAALLLSVASAFGQANAPTPVKGYSLSVFATGVVGQYTKPDSIAVYNNHVYIAYGNGNDPAGADGKTNVVIEYTRAGQKVYSFKVKGHNDGLKVNPYTHKLWVMQNEDANPSLVVFDPETREKKLYTFEAAPTAGGGYDDIAFRNGKAYLSASNPANSPNTGSAIDEVKLENRQVVVVKHILAGNATATNILTGQQVTLNLQDPDSMTTTAGGELVLDSQGDSELVMVRKPGTQDQSVLQIPLSSPYGQPQIDDTLFTPANDGFLLVTDTAANITYKITKTIFAPGAAYSAGVAGTSAAPGFVGRLDVEFGQLTPIVSGMQSPHGLAFVKTSDEDDSKLEELKDACNVLFPNL
ncbi:MAG: hypothetical protein M3Y50_16645 [Acidobacteriota bacterium]|nr:hypothetical protein [Acidobacteriota bacterium]